MPLEAESARRVYDRIGRAQDTQRFYEDPATHRLAVVAGLGDTKSLYELGCGTGRYAAWLLATTLRSDARYLGVDVSPTMVRLAGEHLARWQSRAETLLVEPPALALPGVTGAFNCFLATYVFDLLPTDDARTLVGEARRLLASGGCFAAVSLTPGNTVLSRLVSGAWNGIASRGPALVGGCRPIELGDLLEHDRWRIVHREIVRSWGVPSEVLVAERRD